MDVREEASNAEHNLTSVECRKDTSVYEIPLIFRDSTTVI